MFVSVGSHSNVAEGMGAPRADGGVAKGGRWAPPGAETDRADVLAFDPEGKDSLCHRHPQLRRAGDASGHRRRLVLDQRARRARRRSGARLCDAGARGRFYGWPWYYIGDNEDPRHAGARPDLEGKVTVPDVLIQAHSASLGMTFYSGTHFRPSITATPSRPSTARGTGRAAPATR